MAVHSVFMVLLPIVKRLFSQNKAFLTGGAIRAEESSALSIGGSNIKENFALSGAGIYIDTDSTASMKNWSRVLSAYHAMSMQL